MIHGFLKWWIRQRFRCGRGKSWFNEVRELLSIVAYFGIVNEIVLPKAIGSNFGMYVYMFFPLILILFWFIGRVDEKRGVWKYENEWTTRNFNPVFKEIERNTRKIR